jgi:hypothetical protein
MANILRLLFKGWILKKMGASGCLVIVILIVVLAVLVGYLIAN